MSVDSGTIPLSRSLDKPPYKFMPLSLIPALELKPPSSQTFFIFLCNFLLTTVLLIWSFSYFWILKTQTKLDDSELITTHGLTSSKHHTAKFPYFSLLEEATGEVSTTNWHLPLAMPFTSRRCKPCAAVSADS